MARHYTAYAELGDLCALLVAHLKAESHLAQVGRPNGARIPVIAILHLFEAMAAGACLMAHGAVPDDHGVWPTRASPWAHDIVHRDIKPSNYFLTTAAGTGSKIWPGLPVATLGDFGNGIDMAGTHCKDNPRAAFGIGTPRWEVPEQLDTGHSYPISSRTNIYQIGICILELMALSSPLSQRAFRQGQGPADQGDSRDSSDNQEEDEEDWDIDEDEDGEGTDPADDIPDELFYSRTGFAFYPKRLVRLAVACIRLAPASRPSPKQLYMAIRKMATAYEKTGSRRVPFRKFLCERGVGDDMLTRLLHRRVSGDTGRSAFEV